jgi:single-strand selective monofunctional uracil DNA glycosylase
MHSSQRLIQISRDLADEVRPLSFAESAVWTGHPLDYARAPHERYLRKYGACPRETLLFGMNPGPWGMSQTGVPFGDVTFVRDWLKVEGPVEKPAAEHPKRPIEGFDCRRGEVSGQRLWGWAQARFGTAENFFARFFVHNYCPLCFLADTGRNITPDKLAASERKRLFEICNRAVRRSVDYFSPRYVIGIGAFAEKRLRESLPDFGGVIGRVLHPSPASPAANRGWAEKAEADLRALGVKL